MSVKNYMKLSTHHLSPGTRQKMAGGALDPWVDATPDGFLVELNIEPVGASGKGKALTYVSSLPGDLVQVMCFAMGLGCDMVYFVDREDIELCVALPYWPAGAADESGWTGWDTKTTWRGFPLDEKSNAP